MPHDSRNNDVFFNQPCPVCGRMLHVRLQLLGRRVYCQHCGGGFTAVGESLGGSPTRERVDDLLARASETLERAAAAGDGDAGFSD